MTYNASIKLTHAHTHTHSHMHTHTVGSRHISPLTLVPFAFIDLVIMLLFRYLGAKLLCTAAVVLTFTAQTRGERNTTHQCTLKVNFCMQELKFERLDEGENPCKRFTDKVLQCADSECSSFQNKAIAATTIRTKVCAKCQETQICSYGELLAEKDINMPAMQKSSCGAIISARAVVVLLSVLKTVWVVCM